MIKSISPTVRAEVYGCAPVFTGTSSLPEQFGRYLIAEAERRTAGNTGNSDYYAYTNIMYGISDVVLEILVSPSVEAVEAGEKIAKVLLPLHDSNTLPSLSKSPQAIALQNHIYHSRFTALSNIESAINYAVAENGPNLSNDDLDAIAEGFVNEALMHPSCTDQEFMNYLVNNADVPSKIASIAESGSIVFSRLVFSKALAKGWVPPVDPFLILASSLSPINAYKYPNLYGVSKGTDEGRVAFYIKIGLTPKPETIRAIIETGSPRPAVVLLMEKYASLFDIPFSDGAVLVNLAQAADDRNATYAATHGVHYRNPTLVKILEILRGRQYAQDPTRVDQLRNPLVGHRRHRSLPECVS